MIAADAFLSAFGSDGPESSRFDYPQGVCYLDRWNAPSSSVSSLFLIVDRGRISIWDVDHLQHLLNIDLDFFPHNIGVDLNGLIYVFNYYCIQILDPRKNYHKVQTFYSNRGSFHNVCVDDSKQIDGD